MKKIICFGVLALIPLCMFGGIHVNNPLAHDYVDSIIMQKKQVIKRIIVVTDSELEKLYNEKPWLITNETSKDIKSRKPIIIIEDKTPKSFGKLYNSQLYSSKEWENYQKNLIHQYSLNKLAGLMKANETMTGEKADWNDKKLVSKLLFFSVLLTERYYLPNFKIAFLNNLSKEGFQRVDLPLVIETLAELADSTMSKNNQSEKIMNVDDDIPENYQKYPQTYAVIISNERYDSESNVECAINDGKIFGKYCKKLLGVPDANIHYVENATYNDFINEIDWLNEISNASKGEANILFFYAGHGYPGESDGRAYLLPIDGSGKNLRTCLKLEELYEMFAILPVQRVTVFLDACFSGVKRNGTSLNSARGVAIKVKQSNPKGNVIVFSAAQEDETAYSYKVGKHGLFTYFLLKKLKETSGDVTYGELSRYIEDQVVKTSIKENGKKQTPCAIPSLSLSGSWEKMKLKE